MLLEVHQGACGDTEDLSDGGAAEQDQEGHHLRGAAGEDSGDAAEGWIRWQYARSGGWRAGAMVSYPYLLL